MNISESKVREQYEKRGWEVIRGGSPDFMLVKRENGKIIDVMFCEVKSKENNHLQYNQKIYRQVIKDVLKQKYELIVVDTKNTCCICGKELTYSGIGRPPKYCDGCAKEALKYQKNRWAKKHGKSFRALPDSAFAYSNDAYRHPETIVYKINYFYDNLVDCPDCHNPYFDFDTEHGEVVCTKCGLVVGEYLK